MRAVREINNCTNLAFNHDEYDYGDTDPCAIMDEREDV